MRLGVFVSNEGDHATRLGLAEMAASAEEAGADGLWVSDHVALFDQPTSEYPFSADGRPNWELTADYFEALACCATIAAATQRCRVGTAILVLPQRNVLEVAKTAATIDAISGGRMVLGLGAGWYSAEMEALGHSFARRGRRFDEMLDVLRDCWTGRPAAYEGEEISIPEHLVMRPRPVQRPGIPLLVGGMSAPARRRAATRGDGWLALATDDEWDAERLAHELDEVRSLREADGPFEFVLQLNADPTDGARIAELVAEAAAIGFGEAIVEPPWSLGIDAAAGVVREARAVATAAG